jgi:hypothetical protein
VKDRKKQPRIEEHPEGRKQARSVFEASVMDRKAAWRINRLQMVDPYGFHTLSSAEACYIQTKLAEFERKTWNEIFTIEKHWNHALSVSQFKCPKARKWMRENMPDQNELWTLRLSGAERIWGVFSEGVYLVVFWDPKHLIWETDKK